MRQSPEVLWMLTKRHNAFKTQQKGARTRREAFSTDPLNNTGLHNQSSAGFTNDHAVSLAAVTGVKSAKGKGFRRVIALRRAHKQHNKKSNSPSVFATSDIKTGVNHAAKTIKGLSDISSAKRAVLLKRLGRIHASTRDHLQAGAK